MNIPKLAKGGIVSRNPFILGIKDTECVIPLQIDSPKYLKIYHKTKNRRIKKKALKKCPMLSLSKKIEKCIGISENMKTFKINIGDREIYKKEVE